MNKGKPFSKKYKKNISDRLMYCEGTHLNSNLISSSSLTNKNVPFA